MQQRIGTRADTARSLRRFLAPTAPTAQTAPTAPALSAFVETERLRDFTDRCEAAGLGDFAAAALDDSAPVKVISRRQMHSKRSAGSHGKGSYSKGPNGTRVGGRRATFAAANEARLLCDVRAVH